MQYLSKDDIKVIHSLLSAKSKKDGEALPSFWFADLNEIDALVDIPQRISFGIEQYPSVETKAAIIFYTINKKQIFVNGNKRMSTACLLVFLYINGKILDVTQDQLTQKALWLAQTESRDFQEIKIDLTKWIQDNIKDITP